jgi:hypothetical protein
MKFLLQFPTLGRPEKFSFCLKKYLELFSKENELHFNINCDSSDVTMNNDITVNTIKYILDRYENVNYNMNFDDNTTKISAINDHIDDKDFDIVICVSDDMIPIKSGWDKIISSSMEKHFPDTYGCLHFNDGLQGNNLITLSILGKKLYDFFGYIYHPDYKSLYCDNEFTNQVYSMNKVAYINEIVIMHEHYSKNGSMNHNDYDYAAQKTLSFAGRDAYVFQQRAALNYPKQRITND